MNKIFPAILFVMSIFLSSCSTDFDVLAPYEETTVVYALLNPADSIQYVKVNKAFLGEGNALTMATVGDSINYGDEINVILQRFKSGSVIQTIQLVADKTIPKNPGQFSYPGQTLYTTTEKIFADSRYNLIVTNSATGSQVTSKTEIVDPIETSSISVNSSFTISFTQQTPLVIKWRSAPDGKIYGMTIRFHYNEYLNGDTIPTHKYVDWVFPEIKSSTITGNQELRFDVAGEKFYEFCANTIPVNNDVERIALSVDFLFTIGGNDLNTYVEANKAPTGIVQEKPLYSNIEGGIGLFSSRFNMGVLDKALHGPSKDELACGSLTKKLRFRKTDNSLCN